MMTRKRKISWYKIKKIIECFVLDLTATQTGYLIGVTRNTINLWYKKFREGLYKQQMDRFKEKIRETIEVDESYFGSFYFLI
jgi:transposase-like protein